MGHLINSTALRLGWFSNWSDSWYQDKAGYAEVLHGVLRIRLFLVYFFSLKKIENLGFFYSHFEIFRKYNAFCVNVFFYDGYVELLVRTLSERHKFVMQKLMQDPFAKDLGEFSDAWRFLAIFNIVHEFYVSALDGPKFAYFLKCLLLLDSLTKDNLFLSSLIQLENRDLGARLVFFFFLYKYVKQDILLNHLRSSVNANFILSRFLYSFFWSFFNDGLFILIRRVLSCVLSYLVKGSRVLVNFFAVTTHTMTSKLWVRYIARRLRQGVDLDSLLDPVKEELSRLRGLSVFTSSFDENVGSSSYKESVFKDFLNSLISFSNRLFFKYYVNTFSWLSLDYILLFKWFFLKEKNIYLNMELFNNRCSFYLLFFNNFFNYTFYFFRLFKLSDSFLLSSGYKSMIFLVVSDIYGFVYLNSYALFFIGNYINVDVWSLFFCNIHARHYLSQMQSSGFLLYLNPTLNRRKLRSVHVGLAGYLMGFKLHCLGRFSRKQRASSLWYKQGKIPLNTMSAIIDFSSISVPIENSVVTIKLWLYRYEGFMKFYFRVL